MLATLLLLATRPIMAQIIPTMFLIGLTIPMEPTTQLMGLGATMLPMEPMTPEEPTLPMLPMPPSTPTH